MTDSLDAALGPTVDLDQATAGTTQADELAAAAVQLAQGQVEIPLPQPGETVRLTVAPGQVLQWQFDPATAVSSLEAGDLALEINGGEVILVGWQAAVAGEPPLELTNADGTVINMADFLVALGISPEEMTLPAAAGALPGTPANQGAGFTPTQAPTILASLDPRGPLGPTELRYGVPEREPTLFDLEEKIDPAGGNLASSVDTVIDGGEGGQGDPDAITGSFSGGFEDWQPNQHLGDGSISPMQLTVTLVPTDNEELESVTIVNIPVGVTIYAPGQMVVGDGSNSITIQATDLDSVWVQPAANTDGDITLSLVADIIDPDSGAAATINGSVTAIVDAAADRAENLSAEAPDTVGLGTTVTFDVQAQFSDWTDGSESQYLLVELPAGWGNPAGYPTESFAAGNLWGIPAGTYVVVDVTGSVDSGSGIGSASIVLQAPTSLPADVASETFHLGVVAKTVDAAGDSELTGLNNVSYSPLGESTEIPEIPVVVVKPQVSINDVTVNEEDGTATFTITLSDPSGVTVAFGYATADGSAHDGSGEAGAGIPDYLAASGSIVFDPGETTKTVTVTITDDNVFEHPESFHVDLVGVDPTIVDVPGSDLQGLGTILDTDPAPAISISDGVPSPQVEPDAEGDAPTLVTFTVTLSNPSSQAVTVAYKTVSGTALAGVDFENQSGTITFLPGETSKEITVAVRGDDIDELLETFTVALSSPTNATIADGQGVGQIADTDPAPAISISDGVPSPQVEPDAEGDAPTLVTFTVSLSNPSSQAVTVAYETVSGTALAGVDFENQSGTITFLPGETSKEITVAVHGDDIDELLETFTVALSSPTNATIADGQGVGQIADTDPAPVLTISDAEASEGEALTFTLSLSNPSSGDIVLDLAAGLPGSATPGADYETAQFQYWNGIAWVDAGGPNGTQVIIPAGQTSLEVRVDSIEDLVHEASETFTLTATPAAGSAPVDAADTGTGTILDNDAMPTLAINDVQVTESDPIAGADHPGTYVTFTVTKTGATDQTVTVQYTVMDGSALEPEDYFTDGGASPLSGTLTFAPGETSKTITLKITDDNVVEGTETFSVVLSNPTNATIADDTGIGTVIDDDTYVPDAVSESASVNEGSLINYNLMLILDKSGSMDDDDLDPGPGELSRLQLSVNALENMLLAYDAAAGNVQVQIMTFDGDANGIQPSPSTFYTVEQALAKLDQIADAGAGGNTDYDDATAQAASAFNNWPAESATQQNVVYFLSDGQPNPSWDGLNSSEQAAWQQALDSKGIEVIAVGVGAGITGAGEAALGTVAHPAGNVVIVENDTGLGEALLGTLPNVLTGNVLDNGDTHGGDGWSSPKIVSLVHDGVTYTTASPEYDAVNQTLTIQTALGGKLTINFDTGQYSYQAPNVSHGAGPDPVETFTYTIEDADGDQDSATLSIEVKDGAPVAYDNHAEITEAHLVEQTTLVEGFESNSGWKRVGDAWRSDHHETEGSRSAAMSTSSWDGAKSIASLESDLDLPSGSIQNLLGTGQNNTPVEGSGVAKSFVITTAQNSVDIAFDWYFDAASSGDNDAAVYFIKVDGVVVDSGVLQRRSGGDASGSEAVTLSVTPGTHTVQVIWAAVDVRDNKDTSTLYVDNLTVTDLVATGNAVSGNVLIDPVNDPLSADPLGAQDEVGSDGAALTRIDYINASGNPAFAMIPADGTTVTVETLNGYLTIGMSGAYTYEAKVDAVTAGASEEDVLTYTLTDGDGDTDTATLRIVIGDRITVAEDDASQNATGGDGSDVIIGSSTTNVLSGGDGNDRLVGGPGSDLLTGGDGSDILAFALGDQGPAPAPVVKTYTFQGVTQSSDHANAYEFEVAQTGNGSLLNVGGPEAVGVDLREASNQDYARMVEDDQSYWNTSDVGAGRHAVFWAQFQLTEDPADITRIVLSINARQGGNPGKFENAEFGVWNYNTNSWRILDSDDADQSDNTFSGQLAGNIAHYLDSEGRITLALYNEDNGDTVGNRGWNIDDVRVEVTSQPGPSVIDTITDFTLGAGGDVLDLDDLLPASVTNGSPASTIDNYLHFEKDGDNTNILVDHDGGSTFQPDMQIVLQGVDLTAGQTLTDAQIIQSLVDNGNLAV